jgi:hypothetical protein
MTEPENTPIADEVETDSADGETFETDEVAELRAEVAELRARLDTMAPQSGNAARYRMSEGERTDRETERQASETWPGASPNQPL